MLGDDNDTFVGNRSAEQHDVDEYRESLLRWWFVLQRTLKVIDFVVYFLGVPGNILSAIV